MLRPCLLLLLLARIAFASPVEPALISVGDTWAFLPGTNEPPAAWREPDYDDSAWRRGESGFGTTARGEHTFFLGIPRGSGAMFFRRTFTLDDLPQVQSLTLRLDWQGGLVAYLNGTEIVRRELGPPGMPVAYTNYAELHAAGVAEDFPVPGFQPLLRPGTNVLAIQVHPVKPPYLWDVVLVPELLANFTRGPYVQNRAPGIMDVVWRTPLEGPARVDYGPTPALGSTASAQAQAAYHYASLTNLSAGTTYHYRVTVSRPGGEVSSPTYRFRTLPEAGPVTALLFGDSGSGARSQFAVARQLHRLSSEADLIVHLGDIVYPYLHAGQTDTRCLSVYREAFRSLPSFMTWGNHDLAVGPSAFQAAFRVPTNDTPALEHLLDRTQPDFYYSFDAGDAHFAVLFWPYSSQYFMQPDCPQLQWLERDLAASAKRWKFLCLHHPVNTSSGHRFDDYNGNGILDRIEVEELLLPVARRHGVQMIFSGHDHVFERFQPVGGVHTVVTGGGGVGLYGLRQMDPNSAAFYPRWHLSRLELREDTLRLTALDTTGAAFDVLEFRNTPAGSGDDDGDGLGDTAERLAGSDPARPDTDGDGLPDGWEFLRGMNPAEPSVTRSADGTVGPGDPLLLAEVLAADIPRPRTELRVHALPAGRMQLRWLSAPGFRAQVESAGEPDGEFQPLPRVPRIMAEDWQSLELAGDTAARYFRVRLLPE